MRTVTSRSLAILLAGAVLAACAAPTRGVQRPPLGDDAEVFLYAEPFPRESRPLALAVSEISVVSAAGVEVPLDLSFKELTPATLDRARLLATGRMPPGNYNAVKVRLSKAVAGSDDAKADLDVTGALRVDVPFRAAKRTATVLYLSVRPLAPSEFDLSRVLSARVPASALPATMGLCDSTTLDALLVLGKTPWSVTAVRPTGRSPQGLAIDPPRNRAYVALGGNDSIEIVDIQGSQAPPPIRLNAGDRPGDLLLSLDRRTAVVLNRGSNTMSFVDVMRGVEIGRVNTGLRPEYLLLDRSGRQALALNRGGSSITVVDTSRRAVTATVTTESGPIAAQFSRDGSKLYVISEASAYLGVFTAQGFSNSTRLYVGLGASALKVDPVTDYVYVGLRGESRLQVFDPAIAIPISFVDLPFPATYLAIDNVTNSLLALMPDGPAVAVVDLTTWRTVAVVDVGPDPFRIVVADERW